MVRLVVLKAEVFEGVKPSKGVNYAIEAAMRSDVI